MDRLFDSLNHIGSTFSSVFGYSLSHIVIEVALVGFLIYLIFKKSYKIKDKPEGLSPEEKDALIQEWKPEPLVDPDSSDDEFTNDVVVESPLSKYTKVSGRSVLNVASYNFLNMAGKKEIIEKAQACIRKYGVGSCGPRGFYGTIDVHLDFESAFAKHMNVEECLLYSYGFSTIASMIPAYSKRDDYIFADEGISFPLQKGCQASRSKILYFRHNDVDHLEELLKKVCDEEAKKRKKHRWSSPPVVRKFILVEGLYNNFGDICPLPKIVAMKYKYCARIMLDETYSIGTLGKEGKGVTDLFNVPIVDIDCHTGSLETSFGSVGGMGFGRSFIVTHQEVNSSGFCFSASLPPYLAVAASCALEQMQQNPDMFARLNAMSITFQEEFMSSSYLTLKAEKQSPIKHIYLSEMVDEKLREKHADAKALRIAQHKLLKQLADEILKDGVLVTVATYLYDKEHLLSDKNQAEGSTVSIKPSIRISLNVELTEEELSKVHAAFRKADTFLSSLL